MYLSPQEGSMSAMGLGMPGLSMGDNFGDEALGNVSEAPPFTGSPWSGNSDNVERMQPPFINDSDSGANGSSFSSMFAPFFTAMGSLFSQMSQMFSGSNATQNSGPNLGNCTQQSSPGNCGQPGQAQWQNSQPGNSGQMFQNATASSNGDPHLAFNGTDANGSVSDHWDNMNNHGDLLDSNSFRGGYRVSTQETQPSASGVTYNQAATVSMSDGRSRVSLDNNGNATFLRNGNAQTIQDGQSFNLGRGESVTRNNDGTLVVSARNAQGGTIATTLHDNGPGVDINVQANNVDLGGYMVNTAEGGIWQQ